MTSTEFTCASFYQALSEKRLIGTRCRGCNTVYLPPRQICPRCHSTDVEPVNLKGKGKLVTFTTIAVGTSEMAAEGYDRNHHYCCGVVELAEGPRVCALITGVNAQDPYTIEIGKNVEVEFPDSKDKLPLLRFTMV